VNQEELQRRTPIVRSLGFCALLVVFGLVAGLFTPSDGPAQPKMPDPFAFPQGKDSPGAVTFDHAKHKDAGNDKCTACHIKVFKFKKGGTGPLTMAKMKGGELCGACHNGKTQVGTKVVFTTDDKANCERCHKK
jgi:c(7)-type cytochrome triheme protein